MQRRTSRGHRAVVSGGALIALTLAACTDGPQLEFVAVTFNTGTSVGLGHDSAPEDGYTQAHATLSDTHYGNGLAWMPAVGAAQRFFADVSPDVIAFQEIFFADECADIPQEARRDFYCETWQPGDPTVANVILGPEYQVACNLEKPDKCLAVHERFGTFRGCTGELCLDHLAGARLDGCGRGARIGGGIIDLTDGGSISVVGVHGSSGLTRDDMACRVRQFDQVFVDLDPDAAGAVPAASGETNVVLGDLNTDPVLMADSDPSAARFLDFAEPAEGAADGVERPYRFVSAADEDAPGSYLGLFNIDHVVSDAYRGDCWVAGLTEGQPGVIDAVYFDHKPVVCTLTGDAL